MGNAAHLTLGDWTVHRAAWPYRRRGNRDLYLRHRISGAQAAIAWCEGRFAVLLAGTGIVERFDRRRDACNYIAARGEIAYLSID